MKEWFSERKGNPKSLSTKNGQNVEMLHVTSTRIDDQQTNHRSVDLSAGPNQGNPNVGCVHHLGMVYDSEGRPMVNVGDIL